MKFGHGLPSLRPTMSSLVDDDDTTVPVLMGYEGDSDDPTLKYVIEERTPRATIPEPAIKRAKARSKKTKALAPTVKKRRFKLSLASLPALVCDVCVAVLFVLFAHAGTPLFARWLPITPPAPIAEVAPPAPAPPIAATPPAVAPAVNVVEAAPTAPVATTTTPAVTAKPKTTTIAKHRKTR